MVFLKTLLNMARRQRCWLQVSVSAIQLRSLLNQRSQGVAMLVLSMLGWGNQVTAGHPDEYAIKAAYLYNFAKFVEWPNEVFTHPQAPLTICIAGDSPFGSTLDTLSGKQIETHPVEVRYLPNPTSIDQCHIAFLSGTTAEQIKPLLTKLANKPVLTVSDIGNFAQGGGIIGLVQTEQRIHFNINLDAARQANLKLSSHLLKLATIVN